MIRGRVTERNKPWVPVELLGRDEWFSPIEFVLDTGFGGDLLLPVDIIQQLEVTESIEIDGALATGHRTKLKSWSGTALWHDRRVSVLILEAGGEPLLGMNLLRGSRVTLDAEVGGDVTIDELER